MPATESGHHPNRVYTDRDGNLHLNGANLYTDESGTTLTGAEVALLDGLTAGTVEASKAVTADANKDVAGVRNLDLDGNLTLTDGGTVTQLTSITTGVTLNTNSGQITTVSSTLAAAGEATFTVTNSNVAATDVVIVCLGSTSSAGTPLAFCSAVAAGSFDITIANLHASAALDNTLVIHFVVIKGAAS